MPRITRREWHRVVLGGLGASLAGFGRSGRAQPAADQAAVRLGVQSYSFRDRPLDAAIDGMRAAGLRSCELWQGHVEPQGLSRDALRQWRVTAPLSLFTDVRAKFERAAIALNAYNLSFRDDFTDEEIARGFAMAAALGAPVITASATQTVVGRVAPHAERTKMRVGMHNHSDLKPNEFATPEDFTRALAVSPMIAANLDIGHFTAANFDALAFLREHHARIVTLHIKDRQRNQGPAVPFGRGDAPIREVLRLLRDRRWPIPANIEYEYEGADTVVEVRRCVEYCMK